LAWTDHGAPSVFFFFLGRRLASSGNLGIGQCSACDQVFVGTFATLLAIINPFEVLPVYLKMLEGRDAATHRQVAWKACLYALLLSLFFF
jgi:MarC family integral membrane protein